jgi:hypothetical protein
MARRTVAGILAALRADVRALEATLGERRPIDQAILDELADLSLPTSALAARLRRRRGDVAAVMRLLEMSGQIRRVGRRWELVG